jgi:hypothetical protein
MPAARLDCLDVVQVDTDVPDDGFGNLNGSIPTLGGSSNASSCPGGAGASCGTIASTNKRVQLVSVLPKLLLVLLLVLRVLWNSDLPVTSHLLVSKSPYTTGSRRSSSLWDSKCMSITAPIGQRTGFQQQSICII